MWLDVDHLLGDGSMKSHVRDCLKLAYSIYKDACAHCVTEISMRDLLTIRSRVKQEGISFLTITLPSFCRDFERCLDLGYVDPKLFRCFRKSGSIPVFLQGMIGRLFDKETGRINDYVEITDSPDCSARLVASVRQICLAFKKIELPCTPEREYKALENFVAIEHSFEMFTLPREEFERFTLVSSVLWSPIVRTLQLDDLVLRHGPGATSERIHGNAKYAWKYWHESLEHHFPIVDFGFPYSSGELDHDRRELETVTFVPEGEEIPVRVTPVPKTLKGPRIIAIEPCCMQYAQQGIRDALYRVIESSVLTRGHVNFRDQKINQSLAISASIDRRLATIDLSDASDRVPCSLALEMFRSNPVLLGAIEACRSKWAKMPDGSLVGPLSKFASMGSALCFPVEAMYFYTLCIDALLRELALPVTLKNIKRVLRDVYVYGDDIICPQRFVTAVLDNLRRYNCKVNDHKTFYHGNFRESCGVDAYHGYEVQPIYVGTVLPKNRRDVGSFLSSVATANLFFHRGYQEVAFHIVREVERVFGVLPQVPERSPVIGVTFPAYSSLPQRWNRDTQQREYRCYVAAPVYRTDPLEGYAALQKCFIRMATRKSDDYLYFTRERVPIDKYVEIASYEASLDPKHLERTAQHGAATIKRRWVPRYNLGFRA